MMAQQRRLLILGAGTGGTLAANRLRKKFKDDKLRIDRQLKKGIHYHQCPIVRLGQPEWHDQQARL